MKEKITSKFKEYKESFNIESMGVEGGIDPMIKDFMLKLNESEHITTIYSCEGHSQGDNAYMLFSVSEEGWDLFWLGVMPELSSKLLRVDDRVSSEALLQMKWNPAIVDNKYNTAISIDYYLDSHFNDIITWEENKEIFWDAVKSSFIKYFIK